MLAPLPRSVLEEDLYWASAPDSDSEFTPEDPLALGYLSQQVGYWLFEAFTTRTSRAQNYAVVLYGLDLAERSIREQGLRADDEMREALFNRWERFWSLAVLESLDGQLARGDENAMRGVRGAKRAWFRGEKALPLDFKLIERQTELGGLGAYLSSLRSYGLVFPGTLHPTPAARGILDAFWDEPGNLRAKSYDSYALHALELSRDKIERRFAGLTLAKVGERSRLTALVELGRREQQERLWAALFENARDCTLALAERIRAAARKGVTAPREFLETALEGRWGPLGDDLRQRLLVALAFGDVYVALQERFDAIYRHIHEAGWVAKKSAVARSVFSPETLKELGSVCTALLAASRAADFQRLEVHGRPFIRLVTQLQGAGPEEALAGLLYYHREVQRDRRSGGAWIREDGDELVLSLGSYGGFAQESGFPSLKMNVVRTLLRDLGRL
ncbi:hypothetical protein [Archangium lipolyticum]|uniref:hypothetical protein n=1 Tax=Archangium lipolyticum TaxID=2970465 RepID=UPI00214A40A8|nr:hypothetical protein [Archangium lipolyticum]